ncbi:hypothetical protein FE634_15275 [Nocardioides dongxiaopingii]|uniref:hypothetical protein n=1 Tax=Nocardioides sp. S-1144 TaxID=2582905 RepID=UPI00110DD5B8|nr:hypothetical protein [Nocardioides sp. S-1144]QCW51423.1 hypothetical protein FE634_15275 [Nocardioides sp. S-1144]
MSHSPTAGSPWRVLVQMVRDWPVASQQQARRNAMVATTSCARRRVERQEVADFLAARPADGTAPAEQRAGHRTGH